MTEDELATIEARANAATIGPWRAPPLEDSNSPAVVDGPDLEFIAEVYTGEERSVAEVIHGTRDKQLDNATFIAAARTDVVALVAEVRRLTVERDAAFTRGVEAMRGAAAKVAAECASERGHTQATMFAASRPDDAFVVGIKGGEASRIEALIRALKVTP